MALAVLALLLAVIVAFDWNWFRPLVERSLTGRSGRVVRIDDLHVSVSKAFEPTVRLRGVMIENADWADTQRPMAVAREASFTFAIDSLRERRPIVSKLVLIGADVDLELRSDGTRNWRLRNPDDRSAGRVKVRQLEMRDSRLRVANAAVDLDMTVSARPIVPGSAVSSAVEARALSAAGDPTLPPLDASIDTQLAIEGRFRGQTFTASVLTPSAVSIQETDRSFALRGRAVLGATTIAFDGRIADLRGLRFVDGRLRLSGADLAQLSGWFARRLPSTARYDAEAQVKRSGTAWRWSELRAVVGQSDLRGSGLYDHGAERPTFDVTLTSQRLRTADFPGAGSAAASGRPVPADASASSSGVSSRLAQLRGSDGRAHVEVERLVVAGVRALESVTFDARLERGVLRLTDLELGIAGGRARGALAFDAHDAPALDTQLRFAGLRLERLSADERRFRGALGGDLSLRAQGGSPGEWLATSSGRLTARLSDASLSRRLDAELGLNGATFLKSLVTGNESVPIRCAVATLDLNDGVGRARSVAVETDSTRVVGVGTFDLRKRTLELVLTPDVKGAGWLALKRSIRVQGPMARASVELIDRRELPGAAGCREAKG